jgi:hypothetical protein
VESLKRRISLDGALKERSVQMKNRLVFILAVAVMTAMSARAAPTYTYGFSPVQTTAAQGGNVVEGDNVINQSGLFVTVEDVGSNQVLFTFVNQSPTDNYISGVYFYDSVLAGMASSLGGTGVDFIEDASGAPNPKDLLTANKLVTGYQAVDGVQTDEQLGILFTLQGDASFNDMLNALNNRDLLIGITVQSVGSYDIYVNDNEVAPIPVPGAIWLVGIGVSCIGWLRRRRTI